MKVKYSEGEAALIVDGVGVVNRGEEAEVPAELGEQLLAQGWELVEADDLSKLRKPELKAKAAELGVEGTSKLKKAQLVDAIEQKLQDGAAAGSAAAETQEPAEAGDGAGDGGENTPEPGLKKEGDA